MDGCAQQRFHRAHTQPSPASDPNANPYADDAGPFNQYSGLKCDDSSVDHHLQHTELPAAAVNTIPSPISHGYLYGSSTVVLLGEPPYSAKQKAVVQAGSLRPSDYTYVNHSFGMAAGGAISTAKDLATGIEALVTGHCT